MEDNNTTQEVVSTEEGAILPDGWDGEGDFFAWASNSGNEADVPLETLLADEADSSKEDAPTTSEETSDGSTTDDSATSPTSQGEEPKSTKLSFEATVDHRKRNVEIDESDLPDLYQKAQVSDRLRNKLNAKENEQEKAAVVAELLGYKSIDEMLDAAKKSYIDGEINKLTKERVHPTIARDTVDRKVKAIEDKAAANRKQVTPEQERQLSPTGRTYEDEVADLTHFHSELRGKQLPKEVVDEFVQGTNLTVAYERYLSKQTQAEMDKLRNENKTLKRNAETAKRAPVRGTSRGGATNTRADDPFLAGFNR